MKNPSRQLSQSRLGVMPREIGLSLFLFSPELRCVLERWSSIGRDHFFIGLRALALIFPGRNRRAVAAGVTETNEKCGNVQLQRFLLTCGHNGSMTI